ncbi:hypothetical protein PILCRDRAFT_769997 [Piloderma croceum F 1598]|uniref:Uncharacterized protein n=1 Tax=Piloderma croceum (strain F 1598) TaxID=765440 RepID=A0A0C3GAF4_PILCF|nr:hypothetical protein PILCRDRAFT_769997 [Piloderma croceum F 1598]
MFYFIFAVGGCRRHPRLSWISSSMRTRAQFKDVQKSGRTINKDWPQYWDYARHCGSIYGMVVGMPNGGGTKRSTASTGEMMTDQEKCNCAAMGETYGVGAQSTSPQPMSPTDPLIASMGMSLLNLQGLTPMLFNTKRASGAPIIIPCSAPITHIDLIASSSDISCKPVTLSTRQRTTRSTFHHHTHSR